METELFEISQYFGYDAVYSGAQLVHDSSVLLAAGNCLLIHDAHCNQDIFTIKHCKKVTAFKVSKSGKYILVAGIQQHEDLVDLNQSLLKEIKPFIAIYSSRNDGSFEELLRFPNQRVLGEIFCIEIAQDDTELVTVHWAEKSQAILRVWDMSNGVCLAQSQPTLCKQPSRTPFAVSQIRYCPGDNSLLTWADGVSLYFMRHVGDNIEFFTELKLPDSNQIVCHDWLDDTTILCGCGDGQLMLFHEKDLLDQINVADVTKHSLGSDLHLSVRSICVCSRYLLVGTVCGVALLWKLHTSKMQWMAVTIISLPTAVGESSINPLVSISVSTTNDWLCFMSGHRVWRIHISKLPLLSLLSSGIQSVHVSHVGQNVTSVDCSFLLDRMATADSAGYLTVTHLMDGSCLVHQKYATSILSVSIHPLSFHVLLAHHSHVSLGLISQTGIETVASLAYDNVKQAQFSTSGSRCFVLTSDRLTVLETRKFEQVWVCKIEMKGLYAKWNRQDTSIAVVTRQDIVLVDAKTSCKRWAWSSNVLEATDLEFFDETRVLLLASDNILLQINNGEASLIIDFEQHHPTAMVLLHQDDIIVIAIANQSLKSYKIEAIHDTIKLNIVKTMKSQETITKLCICRNGLIGVTNSDKIQMWKNVNATNALPTMVNSNSTRDWIAASAKYVQALKAEVLQCQSNMEETKTTAENLLDAQKTQREAEMDALKAEHDQQMQSMNIKIQELELALKTDSEEHQTSMAQLQDLYEQESKQKGQEQELRLQQYSTMLEEETILREQMQARMKTEYAEGQEKLQRAAAEAEDELMHKLKVSNSENLSLQAKLEELSVVVSEYEGWKTLDLDLKLHELQEYYNQERSKVKIMEDKIGTLQLEISCTLKHENELLEEIEKLQNLNEENRKRDMDEVLKKRILKLKKSKASLTNEVDRLANIIEKQEKQIDEASREAKQEIIRRQQIERHLLSLDENLKVDGKPVEHNKFAQPVLSRRISQKTISFPPLCNK